MLYRTSVSEDDIGELDDLRSEFIKIYHKHGVKIIGYWRDKNKPVHTYYMSEYKDEEEYRSTIEKLHSDEDYIRLSARLNAIRTDSTVTRLIPL
ncbi:MAG: hypothetical protein GF411_17890 [Candidatus Lokiarchaeota archaeon]|nr:hypothetical protein [Candidatus Lokiarchaeota archaeon]